MATNDDAGEAKPVRKMMKTDDPGLLAIAKIQAILKGLTDHQRLRVLQWVYDRERERVKEIASENLWPKDLKERIGLKDEEGGGDGE
jgi:hypothetical protein